MAVALACLEIALKEAPQRGWLSGMVIALLFIFAAAGSLFVARSLGRAPAIVDIRALRDRDFAIGCLASFVLGMGLFGLIYLMPIFLAYVRDHGPLQIGGVMLVTGAAQLLTAPLAVKCEERFDSRLLAFAGFAVFAAGLGMSAFQTRFSDYDDMFWPQVVRGCAIMFCLLPSTRLALGHLARARVADASGLFNLMRTLGGAIGIALADTIIYGRAPAIGASLRDSLMAGDMTTARRFAVPSDIMAQALSGAVTDQIEAKLTGIVEKAALTGAINEAWALLAACQIAAMVAILFVSNRPKAATSAH